MVNFFYGAVSIEILGSSSKVTEVEVLVGGQWVPGPSPPGKITSASADVLGKDVYLFGGQGSSKSMAIYVLRQKSNYWERLPSSLYQPRASHASLVINQSGNRFQIDVKFNHNLVYLVGGEGENYVEQFVKNGSKTRVIKSIKHSNRLYSAVTVLPSNVCNQI